MRGIAFEISGVQSAVIVSKCTRINSMGLKWTQGILDRVKG